VIQEPLGAAFGGAFDEPATLSVGSVTRSLRVIFDQGYSSMGGLSMAVEGRRLVALVRTAELAGLGERGATLTLRGKTYRVTSPQPVEPDGELTELELKE
jgi:hypothetical protein